MANSKYEYVKHYETVHILLPTTYIIVRVDGRGFHKLSNKYGFEKPNDRRALNLMNAAATGVLRELSDISIAYGISDEFSFVFDKSCTLFDRRESKIITTVVSTFTSYYIHLWPSYFPDKPLSLPLPTFDGRAVLYPSDKLLRDYLSWRQVDCGISPTQAEDDLKGTLAADKNEILFRRFQINYNDEPDICKKGSTIYRDYNESSMPTPVNGPDNELNALKQSNSKNQVEKERKMRARVVILTEHVDIIKDVFWDTKPWLLSGKHA